MKKYGLIFSVICFFLFMAIAVHAEVKTSYPYNAPEITDATQASNAPRVPTLGQAKSHKTEKKEKKPEVKKDSLKNEIAKIMADASDPMFDFVQVNVSPFKKKEELRSIGIKLGNKSGYDIPMAKYYFTYFFRLGNSAPWHLLGGTAMPVCVPRGQEISFAVTNMNIPPTATDVQVIVSEGEKRGGKVLRETIVAIKK